MIVAVQDYVRHFDEEFGSYEDAASGERMRIDQMGVSVLLCFCELHDDLSRDASRRTIASTRELLRRVLNGNFTCLIGQPACGKTITMLQVASAAAASVSEWAHSARDGDPPRIPIFARAAELSTLLHAEHKKSKQLGQTATPSCGPETLESLLQLYVSHRYKKYEDVLKKFLKMKRVLLIIDGLDEAGSMRASIESFADTSADKNNVSLIISTRHYAFKASRMENRLNDFQPLKILPFDEQRRNYLIRSRLLGDQQRTFCKQLAVVAQQTPEMESSPFLLALLIEVFKKSPNHEIPTSRTELYDRQIHCTLMRHTSFKHLVAPCVRRSASLQYLAAHKIINSDLYRQIKSDPQCTEYLEALKTALRDDKCEVETDLLQTIDVVSLRHFLELLAFVCQVRLGIRDFKWDSSEIQEEVQRRWEYSVSLEVVSRYLLDLSSVGILSRVGEGQFRFSHLSLQEYLAAAFVVRIYKNDMQQLVHQLEPLDSQRKGIAQFVGCMLGEEACADFCQFIVETDFELVRNVLKERYSCCDNVSVGLQSRWTPTLRRLAFRPVDSDAQECAGGSPQPMCPRAAAARRRPRRGSAPARALVAACERQPQTRS